MYYFNFFKCWNNKVGNLFYLCINSKFSLCCIGGFYLFY